MRYVSIPKDRIGVLIGPEGKVKRTIESRCSCKLRIDSETGAVTINDSKDPYMGMKAGDIIKAIGRGFSPEHAFRLFSDNEYFFLFDIREFSGKSRNRTREVRGRLIGTEGKMRHNIEKATDALLAIRGNTVAIICDAEGMEVAKRAVEMLLSGSEHSAVNKFLEKSRPKMAWERMNNPL